jgi:glycosyltransferase involved in cell wall biosynthesis
MDRIRGVTVRRFPNAQTRDLEAFNRYSTWIFENAHSRADEMEWLKQQGPWSPALIDYLRGHHHQYDVLIFFTYLYATTVVGMEVCPSRSVLVPTTHDEPASRLSIYRDVFAKPAAIMYNTESERRFIYSQFPERPLLEEVVGVGVDLPSPGDADIDETSDPEPPGPADEDEDHSHDLPSHLMARGATFRRRHRLYGPMALYGGRIDPGKGCEELFEYFGAYVKDGGEALLALMGVKLMPLPEEPFVRFAGRLSDRERLEALEAATVVVCPSPYESLSLLALEAFSVGTPILVNARSEVLVDHCRQSQGGLYYSNSDEFVECLTTLVRDESLRAAMGRNGRAYVKRHYRWDVVLSKYERVFAMVRNAR